MTSYQHLEWIARQGQRIAALIVKNGGVYNAQDDTIKFPNRAAAVAFAWDMQDDDNWRDDR